MKNKNIWILNMTAGKIDSGWGERHYYMSTYWVRKGYAVKIISGSYNHLFHNQPNVKSEKFTIEEVADGITFCWVKTPKYDGASVFKIWSMIVFAFKILSLPSLILGKPSIILVSSMPIFPILSGWYLKKKYNAEKLLFEIRDLWPLTPMYLKGYGKWNPMIMLMRWIERFGYRKADEIISLLPNADNYINAISGDKNKFHWIPNGIDEKQLVDEKIPIEITEQIPRGKFIIGYAGTMGMANALEYLIESSILLNEKSEYHFVFVGSGYLKNELKKRIKANTNVTFISKINKNQVQHMLSFFDVCFVGRNDSPLFNYGVSSNKFFDYMLAKKPIISSSNKIKDPVELSGCGIVVTPESPEAIFEGINELFNLSRTERDQMGQKGYNYVLQYHSYSYLSELYLKIF